MRFSIKETVAKKNLAKLSVKDKKLIQLMIQDSRMPVTQLAKKVGVSKSAIVQKTDSLKKRGILLDPILYTSVNPLGENLYILEISTQLGMTTEKINEELLKIKEIAGILWYNGIYNLTLAVNTDEPEEIIDKIEEITEIKKFRLLKIRDNWFHPPHLFKEIKDKIVEFVRVKAETDDIDKKIINYLGDNPSSNFAEISEKTKLAPQTIKKHLEKLEKNKTILGFSAFANPWFCGKEVVGVSFIVKGKKETEKLAKHLLGLPQTSNVWECDNEWNINVVFWVEEQIEVNKILNHIHGNFKILDTDISVLVAMVGK
ncbi:winged helix-turn-helix transcriptional regulator [Candidatus Pacearchaeota archaeon]|nr:winged helix-turn-helix transcriptional regulator [Candidatus Pacearchaeota archaeon]